MHAIRHTDADIDGQQLFYRRRFLERTVR